MEWGKKFTIDYYYRLLSGYLVTFTSTIIIVDKVSFAIHCIATHAAMFSPHKQHAVTWRHIRMYSPVIKFEEEEKSIDSFYMSE